MSTERGMFTRMVSTFHLARQLHMLLQVHIAIWVPCLTGDIEKMVKTFSMQKFKSKMPPVQSICLFGARLVYVKTALIYQMTSRGEAQRIYLFKFGVTKFLTSQILFFVRMLLKSTDYFLEVRKEWSSGVTCCSYFQMVLLWLNLFIRFIGTEIIIKREFFYFDNWQ